MAEKTTDLETATVARLVAALSQREVSALELCDRAIARIERDDGPINAVVVRDFERARAAAREADRALATGDTRPLLGVPMTVKESFDVAGLPTTWGFPAYREHRVSTDAVAVARLRRAGAVILGKTNVALALSDWQSENPVYGRTRNPRDLARTCGGSSGGSAAALAAGFVPLELGSDIAGSIRVPAHFCGVFGHKPSEGLVPMRGHAPPGVDAAGALLAVLGPMARCTEDLVRALDVIAGPDLPDAVAYRLDLPGARHPSPRGARILVLEKHPRAATDGALRGALQALTSQLAGAGAIIHESHPSLPDLATAHDLYMKMFRIITSGGAPEPDGTTLSVSDWMGLMHARGRVRRQWAEVFRDIDVVLAPPFGTVAFPHFEDDGHDRQLAIDGVAARYEDQFAWPGVATFPGLPSTALPIATTREGLPIGVQVIGPLLEDRTPLAIAAAIEKLRG